MADAVRRFLDGLTDDQRAVATFPFDGDERYLWHYTPVARNGLQLKDMSQVQRALAFALMRTGFSERAGATARQIIDLEPILSEHERIDQMPSQWPRDSERYWFSVFGEPGSRAPWAWRVGGHHIGLCHTVVDGDCVAATPLFLGANPARVRFGPLTGHRTLPDEEDIARALLASLNPAQRDVAIVDPVAPRDILTTNLRRVEPAMAPAGIRYEMLTGEQRGHLVALVRHYVTRAPDEISAGAWTEIERDGLDGVGFAWAGPQERGHGHYYAIKGPRFLIEYDNTQNDANHIHSVWRDYASDWGEDLLAAHYADTHHQGDHGH
ncbi:MAG: DUF3500 domain-containing protein [Chloroflexi bacterium]|nr:DUF3500 domain-containing protein [Chloroflexota bacterium]